MPECWRISPRRAARPGVPAWHDWRRVRTWSPNSPGSARSFIATTLTHIAAIVADTLAMFGADRCLFGSNFPIEKLWTNYRDLIDAYLDCGRNSNPRTPRRDPARHGNAGLSSRALSRARKQTSEWESKHGVGNQDSRLWRHRAGIEFPCAWPRLRTHPPRPHAGLSHYRRHLSDRDRHRLSLQSDHGDARHARPAIP